VERRVYPAGESAGKNNKLPMPRPNRDSNALT
jgi:hypothetical protein